ncbi:MAG: patatin-like phospholipase family protein [Thermoanaerobaculia bacterium]
MKHRLGIVLSGGGTRGIAHIGLLKALDEHRLSPECIAGTSSGAIVGALYAAGCSPEEMLEFFKVKSPFKLSKFALGKAGFLDTDKSLLRHQALARDSRCRLLRSSRENRLDSESRLPEAGTDHAAAGSGRLAPSERT